MALPSSRLTCVGATVFIAGVLSGNERVPYPQPPKRGVNPVRILVLIVVAALLGTLLCCGALFIAGTVTPSGY